MRRLLAAAVVTNCRWQSQQQPQLADAPPLPARLPRRSPRAILAAALARAAFIPAFRAAAVLHAGPPLLLVLTAALGTSNGFACACAMMAAPAAAPPGAASLAGNVMVLCVVLGLCLGAGASFLWLLAPPA